MDEDDEKALLTASQIYKKRQFSKMESAVKILLDLIEKGYDEAYLTLGLIKQSYEIKFSEKDVPEFIKNLQDVSEYFKKAADLENLNAYYHLGEHAYVDLQNTKLAIEFYKKGVEKGCRKCKRELLFLEKIGFV